MIHAIRPLILPMLLLPLAAQKTVELVPAGLGGKVDFVNHAAQDQTVDTGGQIQDVHLEWWHHFTVTIDGVGAEGVRSVRVTLRRLRGFLQTPAIERLEFDSDAADEAAADDPTGAVAAPLREAMRAFAGAEFTARVGKDGTLLQSSGLGEKLQQARQRAKSMEGILDGMLSDRALSQLVRGAFGRLPKTPVAVGQSWEDIDDTSNAVPMVRRMQLTLRSFDDDAADITFKGTIKTKAGDGVQPASKIEDGVLSGTLTVSRRDGFTMRAESKSSMILKSQHPSAGEVATDIKAATTLERDQPAQSKDQPAQSKDPSKDQPAKEPAAPPKEAGR